MKKSVKKIHKDKQKKEPLSPIARFFAFHTYLRNSILIIILIVFMIVILYPLFGSSLFKPSFILIIILLFIFAIFLFIMFVGILKKWRWIKILEYIILFIAILFLIRSLVMGNIEKSMMAGYLVGFVLLGIALLIIWIKKPFRKH